jgi:hypothetical protein
MLGVTLDPGIFVIVICATVGAALLGPMILARRRANEERGLKPDFEEYCSGTVGWFGSTNIPMFRLSIYKSFFALALIKPTIIPFSQIQHISVRKGLLKGSLMIELKNGATYRLSINEPQKAARLLRHT